MANSLKIYRTQLSPAKNALLEDIEGYLSAIENKPNYYTGSDEMTYSSNNFQYVKPDLDISIKIDVDRDNNDTFNSIGNYVRIEQYQGQENYEVIEKRIWYYFIVGSKWTAQRTLQLQLSLDTINTFGAYIKDIDNWSDKTDIIRQHMPQYELVSRKAEVPKLVEKIDKAGENITIPYFVKTEDKKIEEPGESLDNPEWYLVYITENPAADQMETNNKLPSENSLKCYIYPKNELIISEEAQSFASDWIYDITTNTPTGPYSIYAVIDKEAEIPNTNMNWRWLKSYNPSGYNADHLLIINADDTYSTKNNGAGFSWAFSAKIGDTITFRNETYTCQAIEWFKGHQNDEFKGVSLPVGLFASSDKGFGFWAVKHNGSYYVWVLADCWTISPASWDSNYSCQALISVDSNAYKAFEDGYFYPSIWPNRNYKFDTNGILPKTIHPVPSSPVNITFKDTFKIYYASRYGIDNGQFASWWAVNGTVEATNPSVVDFQYEKLSSIDYFKHDDSRLVKIITVPYCPTNIEFVPTSTGYNLVFDNNIIDKQNEDATWWNETFSVLPYKRLEYLHIEKTFGKYLEPIDFDLDWKENMLDYILTGNLTYKDIKNEPKLKHSDFTQNKLVYADVSNDIRLEDVNLNYDADSKANINIWYQPTNTLSSDQLYKFEVANGEYTNYNNWDTSMVSKRNNELIIYNNQYINYMKYAYDTERTNMEASAKADRQANRINAITGIAGSVLATVGGMASGNPLVAMGGMVSLGATVAKTYSNKEQLETRIANAQRSLESKVDTLKNQAMNANSAGAAIDLLYNYTDNRLHYMKYEVPELLRNLIWDKFYYTGYAHAEQEKPRLTGRILFNFIQCNPVFKDEGSWVYNYYLTDIKDKFNTGITYYHKIDTVLKNADTTELHYDFNQQFENWDVVDLTHAIEYITTLDDSFEDDMYLTTVKIAVDNPFITLGYKYEIQCKYIDEQDWQSYSVEPVNYDFNEFVYKNDGQQAIPVALRARVINVENEPIGSWFSLTVPKPDHDIYNRPIMTLSGAEISLDTEYTLGPDTYMYYQLRMEYNGDIYKYPYNSDDDYANDYTTADTADVAADFLNRGLNINYLTRIYCRIYNEVSGRYSDWISIAW